MTDLLQPLTALLPFIIAVLFAWLIVTVDRRNR